jgi:hypothetical protein
VLVTSSEGNYILDLPSRKVHCKLIGGKGYMSRGDISRDGKFALASFHSGIQGADRGAYWDAEKGGALHVWPVLGDGHGGGLLTFDGRHRIQGGHGANPRGEDSWCLSKEDLETGKELWQAPSGLAECLTTDGKSVLLLRPKGVLRVDIETGHKTVVWEKPFKVSPFTDDSVFAFSPDRSLFAHAVHIRWPRTLRIELWEVQTGKIVRTMTLPSTNE